MPSIPVLVAAASSTSVRLFSFIFLRWIPGHHFPPLIIADLVVYLVVVLVYRKAFRPSLREAFPAATHGTTNGTAMKDAHPEEKSSKAIAKKSGPEPIFNEDEKSLMKTAILGIPNWKDRELSYITIALNILLGLLTLDLIFRGPLFYPSNDIRFSRVGYVDSTSARVLFREPDSAQLPVYAYITLDASTDWTTVDRIYYLDEETDFTYPLTFSGLSPSTSYAYSLSNNLTGQFTTAPGPRSAETNHLTFLTSSCIKANFPYKPTAHSLSIPGFGHLSTLIESLSTPASFMLFLGDFIYVDVPLRLSSTISHYRSEYRRVYASPSWSLPGIATVPWLHTLDDHEIANDWSGGNTTEPFPSASDPFIQYHVSVNPPIPPSLTLDSNITYFQFARGPATFFMLDTRRYRTPPEPSASLFSAKSANPLNSTIPQTNTTHTMLGSTQLQSLLAYIRTPEPPGIHWKIIASSVPFTKNWHFGTSDSWGGYLAERSIILSAMHAAEADLGIRVVILSGDRHEFAAVRFPPRVPKLAGPSLPEDVTNDRKNADEYDTTPQSGPHEFSVGPLSMFYLPLRTFRQHDPSDVSIKYLPDGNSKIGAVEITNMEGEDSQKSLLKYSLWVDGKVKWEYTLTSPGPGYRRTGGGLLEGLLGWVGAGRNVTGRG